MDFAMREWLTVIISLLIVGVILDGWRRMRQARRDSLKMSLSMHRGTTRDELESTYGSELPNGGARVVGTRDPEQALELARSMRKDLSESQTTRSFRSRSPEQTSLNLDEEVPMLMESVERERVEPILADNYPEGMGDDYADADGYPDDDVAEDRYAGDNYVGDDIVGDDMAAMADDLGQDDIDDFRGDDFDDSDPVTEPARSAAVAESKSGQGQWVEPEEVIIFNIMAKEGSYILGPDLLDVLLDCGMRFGEMSIFHRHVKENGDGPILFSLANMVKPGYFDLDAMEDFDTPGVTLFMTLPVSAPSLEAFEIMVQVAKALATELGADLKDENRSVMTAQTIEHCRQRIGEFERKKKLARAYH